jgi:arabinan endo-1,5-alpha-L-arabinosidase
MWPNHDHAPVVKVIDSDVWTHVAYNHDSLGANLYINGAKVFTNIKLEKDLKECDQPLIVGGNMTTGANVLERPFKGSIDDIRIYNRALSEAEVKALFEFEKVKE